MPVDEDVRHLIQKKRKITLATLLKQDIVQHTKNSILASKVILDEDFFCLEESPIIFLPHVISKYKLFMNTAVASVATLGVFAISKYNRQSQAIYALLPLLPLSCEVFDRIKYTWRRYWKFKQITEFVCALEDQATLNSKVIKQFNKRISTLQELQSKAESNAYTIIQQEEQKLASKIGQELEHLCKNLQAQIIIQATFSEGYYTYVANWSLDKCPENGSIEELTVYIEKLSEFFILLSSNLMSSTVFSLESAMWKLNADFETVFNTLLDSASLTKSSTKKIQVEIKNQTKYRFHKYNASVKPSKSQDQMLFQYNQLLEDCKNRIRIVYDITDNIQTQNVKTRNIFLKEMLDNLEECALLVRNWMLFERRLQTTDNKVRGKGDTNRLVKIDGTDANSDLVNSREAEIGSDDEEFGYSPHESDIEFERKCIPPEHYHEEASKSAMVQNLMLQELRNKMKDVRRIRISRTPAGDLIVQERPETLQESGGQSEPILSAKSTNCSSEQSAATSYCALPKFVILDGEVPPPPPIPSCVPPLKFNVLQDENINSTSAEKPVDKSLLASISSMARQRSPNEEVFGCDGDDYVASDESSSQED